MNVICRCFVFVPVVPHCFTFAFASPWSWHLSHFVVPFFFLFLLLFFFLLRLLLFLFLLLFVLSSFPLLLLFSFLLLLLLLLCLTCLILSFLSGISFDLIIILSRHDRKPPTRHSCPPSKAIASPFHFYPHSPSPSLLRHNNRNRVNIEQVFSGAICIPLPRQPPLRVQGR